MKRRNFVLLGTAGAAIIAIPSWYYMYRDSSYDELLTEPELLSYIWDGNTIHEIGKIYREQYPDENSEPKLVKLLMKGNLTDTITITKFLQQQIQEDYKIKDIVMIDGWLLSVTEARQCALFSLTQLN